MKIATAQIWVHDQDEALAFYTEKLGWEVRADVTMLDTIELHGFGQPGPQGAPVVSRHWEVQSAPTGSFPYMSPEQVRREPLSGQTDLFSVGVLLWEMLVGKRLFARRAGIRQIHPRAPFIRPTEFSSGVVEELARGLAPLRTH